MVSSLIALYFLMAMIATSITSYRDTGDIAGQITLSVVAAPIALAYQVGRLAREKNQSKYC